MQKYSPNEVESKWQKKWAEENLYKTDLNLSDKPKYYNLVMFPYPSGDKLHIGHWYNYAPTDSWGRYMRMKGFNVLQPMGYDSFGLPAENFAIKTGVPPKESIETNTKYMTKQLSAIGAMWDWEKTVVTSSPEYYKWTQWVFIQLFNQGLAYKENSPVNWCPSCQTVLANEQVENGKCERCKHEVTKKKLNQWFFKIRDYAEKLLNFDQLEWPENTMTMQKNWIGKSQGARIEFVVEGSREKIEVFTTRPDTLFGCTYLVLAPEHPMVESISSEAKKNAVSEYIAQSNNKSEVERQIDSKEKTGVFTGAFAVNPINGREVPIWIADYVLMGYGTGAIMAVPGHDQRDYAFAKAFDLPILQVIEADKDSEDEVQLPYTKPGKLMNSEEFDGLESELAKEKIVAELADMGAGEFTTNYKLKDWLISRQRYWGSPIPIVYDPEGKAHAIPEEHLPWLLPEDVEFKPTGESPLKQSKEFVERTEKIFGKGWLPEFDTLDTFMCSSWYFLRYPSFDEDNNAFNENMVNKWLPVDMYVGGPEHACMHLLYARFVTKALKDMGLIGFDEPFRRLVHQGMITKDGAKMSKSKGNVVSPDEFIEKYGSDVFRMYLMFMGPFTEGGDWNDQGITGIKRFVDRFYDLISGNSEVQDRNGLNYALNLCLKKVNEAVDKMHFNVAIAALMEFVNSANKTGIDQDSKLKVILAIAPLAPHLAEELWSLNGQKNSVFESEYPSFDESALIQDKLTIVVQVNGKVRGKLELASDITQDEAINAALEIENVQKFIGDGEIVKEIYVPGKLVSFVVK